MKAAVLAGKQLIHIEEFPVPECQDKEAVVAVKACGICGTDIHAVFSGDLYPDGTVFGHECAGIVTSVGPHVQNTRVGDRVVVAPAPPCGSCIYCRSGKDNLCAAHLELDMGSNPDRPGACAEFIRVAAPTQMIYPLPDSMSFEQGALVEPLAVAFHSVRQSIIKPGDAAVVLGAGPIGLGVVQFLRISGAGQIIVLEISDQRAEMARRFGADVIINPIKHADDVAEKIYSLTDACGAEVVYECTGVAQVFRDAVQYARGGGEVMAIGVIEKDALVDTFTLLTREVSVRGSMCYTAAEFQMVLDFIDRGSIDTDAMISDVITLSDLAEPFFLERVRSADTVKLIVKP